jgi:hypothetical protein
MEKEIVVPDVKLEVTTLLRVTVAKEAEPVH